MISENISIVLREKKKEQNMIMTPVAVELHESMTHIKNSNRFTSNDDNFYFFRSKSCRDEMLHLLLYAPVYRSVVHFIHNLSRTRRKKI